MTTPLAAAATQVRPALPATIKVEMRSEDLVLHSGNHWQRTMVFDTKNDLTAKSTPVVDVAIAGFGGNGLGSVFIPQGEWDVYVNPAERVRAAAVIEALDGVKWLEKGVKNTWWRYDGPRKNTTTITWNNSDGDPFHLRVPMVPKDPAQQRLIKALRNYTDVTGLRPFPDPTTRTS